MAGVQFSVLSSQFSVFGFRFSVFGFRFSVFGVRCSVGLGVGKDGAPVARRLGCDSGWGVLRVFYHRGHGEHGGIAEAGCGDQGQEVSLRGDGVGLQVWRGWVGCGEQRVIRGRHRGCGAALRSLDQFPLFGGFCCSGRGDGLLEGCCAADDRYFEGSLVQVHGQNCAGIGPQREIAVR